MTNRARDVALERIRSNIERTGRHIYAVAGGPSPRFVYTIGVSPGMGFELLFAGGAYYSTDEVAHVINEIAARLMLPGAAQASRFEVDSLGVFVLRPVHVSWVKSLMLGALDFYATDRLEAVQIVPDGEHWTLDVPDTTQPWSAVGYPAWQWLHEPWKYDVLPESTVTTNLPALRGQRVTEAARWEVGSWEMFAGAGPDVPPEDARTVPLGTLLALDPSLEAVTQLGVGQALWRDASELGWHPWGNRSDSK